MEEPPGDEARDDDDEEAVDAQVAPEHGLVVGARDGVGVGEERLVALLEGQEEEIADGVKPRHLDGGEGEEAQRRLSPRGVLRDEDRGPADKQVGRGVPAIRGLYRAEGEAQRDVGWPRHDTETPGRPPRADDEREREPDG